jgi:5'-phosphate synthase pdxT subunit
VRRVGVLALQGDYAAHCFALDAAGCRASEVRSLEDIARVDALVIPGGESTVMGGLLVRFGLMAALIDRIREGMPVFGTCAGLILLAARVEGREQPGIRLLNATIVRNAYGRQIDSFRALVRTKVPGAEEIEAVFIRAPRITALGPGVQVLAERDASPILVRQGNILGATFHPELSGNPAIHRYFIDL